jgi:two-component system sensor histidine kinase RpfC
MSDATEYSQATKLKHCFLLSPFFAFAGAITVLTLQAQSTPKTRRILGIVVDNAVATYVLVVLGEGGAIILGIYLFVALGNGLRYGRFYLHTSRILSVTGFLVVMFVSPFWSQHPAVGLGFLFTLVLVPIYVGVLVERIVVRQRADDANQAKASTTHNTK